MGFGVPAMIATQLIFPDRKVVGVVGDGGFLMTGFEMVNVRRENINPILFVFRDDSLGLIEGMQKRVYQRVHAVALNNPDYSLIAAAWGIDYCLLDDEHSLGPQLEGILQKNSPQLVEVSIHYACLPHYSRAKMNSSAQKLPFTEKVMAGSRIISRKLFPFSQ
jgi:acetolactate synthase-1/2/3 large subunit